MTHLPLADIAPLLRPPVSVKQLGNWGSASKRKSNGFPEPVKTLGRYLFFESTDVQEWWVYYQLVVARMHRQHLNFEGGASSTSSTSTTTNESP